MTKITFLALTFTSLLFSIACQNNAEIQDVAITVEGVAINIENAELAIGDTLTITATVFPNNLDPRSINWSEEYKDLVFWETNNPNVATVTQDGLIKAVGKGKCDIYFICGAYGAKCSVIVRDFDIDSFYGQWLSVDSISYYLNFDETGYYNDVSINWSFDGMRLTLYLPNEKQTYVITSYEPGKITYYNIEDSEKKTQQLKMVAKNITIEDLQKGLMEIAGKDGNKYHAIDLGLPSGVLWSTCNLMAQTPEESGHFYAWGELEKKESYILENYKWYDKDLFEITKYNDTSNSEPINLEMEDDAANMIMGNMWRIPNVDDIIDLSENCIAIWSKLNDVGGIMFISKIKGYEGNSIFLPISGYKESTDNTEYDNTGTIAGIYWTSTLYKSDCLSAHIFYLSNMANKKIYKEYYTKSVSKRYIGACIRPVVNK